MSVTESDILRGLLRLYEAEEDAQVLSLERISDGWETDVYSFVLEYGSPDERVRRDLILRIYPGDGASRKAAREFRAMERLHRAGYPVPQVLHLDPVGALLGIPFVTMAKIEGRPLATVIDESPLETKLDLLTLFCQMFVELHRLDWRPFASRTVTDGRLFLPGVIGQALSRWQGHLVSLGEDDFDPVFRWLRERLPGVRFGHPSVTHGDYHPRNVLLTRKGAAFVIDWTNVEVSDYRVDLAWTLLLTSTYGRSEPRAIVLSEYERIAGGRVEEIQFFDVIACLRRLMSIVVSLGSGANTLGMRPGAEAMMKNVSHIEKVYACLRERTGLTIGEVERLLSSLD